MQRKRGNRVPKLLALSSLLFLVVGGSLWAYAYLQLSSSSSKRVPRQGNASFVPRGAHPHNPYLMRGVYHGFSTSPHLVESSKVQKRKQKYRSCMFYRNVLFGIGVINGFLALGLLLIRPLEKRDSSFPEQDARVKKRMWMTAWSSLCTTLALCVIIFVRSLQDSWVHSFPLLAYLVLFALLILALLQTICALVDFRARRFQRGFVFLIAATFGSATIVFIICAS